jgi:hypothetical protein
VPFYCELGILKSRQTYTGAVSSFKIFCLGEMGLLIAEVGLAGEEAETVETDMMNSARKANMRVN